MFNQKGFSKVAVIIIVLILIGGAYFVFSKKNKNIPAQNTENQNSQSSQSFSENLSTNGWNTYVNEKTDDYSFPKKFSIKYPLNAKIETGVEKRGNFPYIIINFQENGVSCSMISPPKSMGDDGSDGEIVSNKIMIGSKVWEESIRKNSDGIIDFYGLSSEEIPINFDLTSDEDQLYKCLPMYKKIIATIEVIQ